MTRRVRHCLSEHRLFLIVVTLLTLVTTWPTLVYVFRTDVFWLPTGNSTDVFIKLWDIWYSKLFLSGQVDLYHTDFMFYPNGVSLTFHPFQVPQILTVNALQLIMPVTNAYSLTFLIMVFVTALSAYVYVLYLLSDKGLALIGAVVFGLSPHVLGHPNQPEIGFIATLPATVYCLHRGIREERAVLVCFAGLLAGVTTLISFYTLTCLAITAGTLVFALGLSRWHKRSYWRLVILMLLMTVLASAVRLAPMISDLQTLDKIIAWHGNRERGYDLISNFVNHRHPLIGPIGKSVLSTPSDTRTSDTSYLGYTVLLLLAAALINKTTRRKALPWVVLAAFFLLLRLGQTLSVNRIHYTEVPMLKDFLDQLLPVVFESFYETNRFMIGALLPLAVTATYGMAAIRQKLPRSRHFWFTLFLVAIVTFEYYLPVEDQFVPVDEIAFNDWLAAEDDQDIALINLPMGRSQSKHYMLFQALSGYPHAEGAISRTPDSAYNYIRDNHVLSGWQKSTARTCETDTREMVLNALQRLRSDGFTHVVLHHDLGDEEDYGNIRDSFKNVEPSFTDDRATVYRLNDLIESCSSSIEL